MNNPFEDRILFQDNHIIVINKRAGEIIQGDKTGDKPLSETVKEYLKYRFNKPGNVYLGIVHRIDRPTSGAIMFAKTSKAASRLSKMFQSKEIEKTYWAITAEKPKNKEGTLTHYLQKNNNKNKSFAVDNERDGYKKAVLHYEVLAGSDRYHLWEVDLETGRHHQIRVQLAQIGCPIKGDLKYGFARSNKDASISLHARSIEFTHPVQKEPVKITAPVPKDKLWEFFERNVS
ncbi:MAG: RluA family pseudouridine synthase [Salibacter sp.]|uniref:RluA family pseudouridine synthase n=1 Tax=Salibacter sp. TaxID=2010995 RepID=UPI0028701DCF|nr:RluA family pseudouridine synthase [Salibacter sp.]MDR9399098.1 RluA family pseudouridine synthase [Salibacter sp.]